MIYKVQNVVAAENSLFPLNRDNAESASLAPVGVFPVYLNFFYKGMQRTVPLSFQYPIDIPSHGEIVTLKFNDFGTMRRIAGFVDYAIREFYGAGAVSGIDAAIIVQIFLDGITDQPLMTDV